MSSLKSQNAICGLILAGGKSRRMGGNDKGLLTNDNVSLLEHCIGRATDQVDHLIINTNQHTAAYREAAHFKYPIIEDSIDGYLGPLAGVLSAMEWLEKHQPSTQWLMSFPVDTPYFPVDIVAKLKEAGPLTNLRPRYPSENDQGHFTFTLWPCSVKNYLKKQITEKNRSIRKALSECQAIEVNLSNSSTECGASPFFNINTPEDWQNYQKHQKSNDTNGT